ncbi:MAG TPA: gephyrin-like molybdotransferase Glp [Thermoanaerobaculia bacterium]|nr:gephyrin-like molybdotransferase Glp [Thermoanaerobaculia bacterium]
MLPTPEEAWQRIAPHLASRPGAWLPRREAAGRVAARDHEALLPIPPVDVSAMDGYAVAGNHAPGTLLPVAGLVAAGDAPGAALAPGTSLRVMTGAPVPAGADRIVPVERTDRGRETVTLTDGGAASDHIRRGGEVQRPGEPMLPAGALLTAGPLSLAAAHGYERLFVHPPPSVAVLPTGDEVVPPEAPLAPGQIHDSHTDFLLAELARLGLAGDPLGIAPDEPEELAARMAQGLAHDVLLVCGGVSAGELDLVEEALLRLGCEPVVDGVAMQPGKPLFVARHARGLVFGLPGNPASVMVAWHLFVRPALRCLLGLPDATWRGALSAELTGELAGANDRARYLPVRLARRDGRLLAGPATAKGSHDLPAYAAADALVRVPPLSPPLPPGASCEVLPVRDLPG